MRMNKKKCTNKKIHKRFIRYKNKPEQNDYIDEWTYREGLAYLTKLMGSSKN